MPTYLDFETRSEIDLPKCGNYKYVTDSSTDIICLAYKIDDNPTKLWTPSDPIPPNLVYPYYAHNAFFDYTVWNVIGVQKYNFPEAPLEQWIDVAALASYYALPRSLGQLGKVLDLKVQKNLRGKMLMKKISMPPFRYTTKELHEYYDYCVRDVDSMVEIVKNLPNDVLPTKEQLLWKLTCEMNLAGLPIDVELLQTLCNRIEAEKPLINQLLADLTQDMVTKATQIQRIKSFLNYVGWDIPNLQRATIENYLANHPEMDVTSRQVLEALLNYGGAAISKLSRMQNMLCGNRVYDYIIYYKASTGRWAGAGIQPQNFPRAKAKNVEQLIANVKTIPNILNEAKKLIRAVICAPPGRVLVSIDYSAIEYIVAVYLVYDKKHKELYDNKEDQYVDMASELYKKPKKDITEDERLFGKVVVLQCQYQAGIEGLLNSALSWGLPMTPKESELYIKTYRETYYLITEAWWSLAETAMKATLNPGQVFHCSRCFNIPFIVGRDKNKRQWLTLTLPSGRKLYYAKPEIKKVKIRVRKTAAEMARSVTKSKYKYIEKEVVTHLGINSVTKQWTRKGLSPGRIFENIVQATARDVLAEAKLRLSNYDNFKLLCSVHDEFIFETDEDKGEEVLNYVCEKACEPISYLPDLRMRVDGWVGKRYRK